MEGILFALEALVVVGAIVMGTRSSGVGLGIWGGLGVAVLVFVFRLAPGSPPIDAMLIILTVVITAAMMQVAGGIDWMVSVAARAIRKSPSRITLVAPLMSFLFSVGAGTSNVLYPLLPVIYDVSSKNNVRPSRPLSMSVVATGVALACSPVSAAMAAMVTLTDSPDYGFTLVKILSVSIPSSIVGIIVAALVTNRLGNDLDSHAPSAPSDDPADAQSGETVPTATGRRAAIIFLSAVGLIVVFGLFPDLRPQLDGTDGSTPISMTVVIELLMFVASTVIVLVCKPRVSEVSNASVFKAGITSAIALFGLAWLTDTFITAHKDAIVDTVGDWVNSAQFIFFLGVFLVCALTTSQSTATRTIVPIGLAAGVSPAVITGMWTGAFAGIYTLPTNGSQIAAANFDHTGSTQLGTKLIDHSFFVPMLVLAVTTAVSGSVLGALLY